MEHGMSMKDYIALQPEVLQAVFESRNNHLRGILTLYRQIQPDHLYIVASGSSFNAACAASVYMRRALQTDVTVHCPSQVPAVHASRPLFVVISQGGESTNTIRAMEALRAYPVVAMTGTEHCTINTLAAHRLPMGCPAETVGPKTMGFTATILLLSLAAMEAGYASGALSAEAYSEDIALFAAVPAQLRENLRRTERFVQQHLDALCRMKKLAFVGKGVGAEMAREGALKVLETLLIPALHYEFEEYLHGPLCAIDKELDGFYMICTDEDKQRMLDVANAHGALFGNAWMLTGDEAIAGERVLHLLTSGSDATVPFEVILLPQLIASEVPAALGIVDKGMAQFFKFDALVGMKKTHKV